MQRRNKSILFTWFAVMLFLVFLIFGGNKAEAGQAYLTGSKIDGIVRHCYYNYMGSTYIQTIPAINLCPLSIEVN